MLLVTRGEHYGTRPNVVPAVFWAMVKLGATDRELCSAAVKTTQRGLVSSRDGLGLVFPGVCTEAPGGRVTCTCSRGSVRS